jgi:hypothetical protein
VLVSSGLSGQLLSVVSNTAVALGLYKWCNMIMNHIGSVVCWRIPAYRMVKQNISDMHDIKKDWSDNPTR